MFVSLYCVTPVVCIVHVLYNMIVLHRFSSTNIYLIYIELYFLYRRPIRFMRIYNDKHFMLPNKSLDAYKKAINVDITAFIAFLVEHCLYSVLYNSVKIQSQQRFSAF